MRSFKKTNSHKTSHAPTTPQAVAVLPPMCFTVLGGGGGALMAETLTHLHTARCYDGSLHQQPSVFFPGIDMGGSEVNHLQTLLQRKVAFGTTGQDAVHLCRLDKALLEHFNSTALTLLELSRPWVKSEDIITLDTSSSEITGGSYSNGQLGYIETSVCLRLLRELPEDRIAGIRAIIDAVVASKNTYEVRVALIFSGWGGEGRALGVCLPGVLKDESIRCLMEQDGMSYQDAQQQVEKTLKIGVIMLGAAFRYPTAPDGAKKDPAKITAGTIKNYPPKSAEAVSRLYILDHNNMPIQAETYHDRGIQTKHHHACEIVALAMMEHFFSLDQVSGMEVVIPHYTHFMSGTVTTWDTLRLPSRSDYRRLLATRLRFDAVLLLWVKKDLLSGNVLHSEILDARHHAGGNAKRFTENTQDIDLDDEMIHPLKALIARERLFLNWLLDICQTGKDWQHGDTPHMAGSYLFDVTRIQELLDGKNVYLDQYNLDDLVAQPAPPSGVIASDSLKFTKKNLTLHRVRRAIQYGPKGSAPITFEQFIRQIYDIVK